MNSVDPISERRASISRPWHASSRPPSATRIPRPISGSSRREAAMLISPTPRQGSNVSRLSRIFSPLQERQTHQPTYRSCYGNSGMPPCAYPGKGPIHPKGDYVSPCKSELGKASELNNESGSLWTPRKDDRRIQTDPIYSPSKENGIGKSGSDENITKTTVEKRITPRALRQPLQPSLPRERVNSGLASVTSCGSRLTRKSLSTSQSGNAADNKAGSNNTTNSSVPTLHCMKSVSPGPDHHRRRNGSNPVSTDASLPKLANKNGNDIHLVDKFETDETKSPMVLNLSVNDRVNAKRLEDQRRTSNGKRTFFINTTLANISDMVSSPLSSTAKLKSSTTSCKQPPSRLPHCSKDVYKEEEMGYWLGRYMAAVDRLRNTDSQSILKLNTNVDGTLDIASQEVEVQFDKFESSRQARVLDELRQYCKTETAARGFQQFENQMMQNLTHHRPDFSRSKSEQFTGHQAKSKQNPSEKIASATTLRSTSNKIMGQLSFVNAQATLAKLSGLVSERGQLAKSKTIDGLIWKSVARRPPTPGNFCTERSVIGEADRNLEHETIPKAVSQG